MITIAVTFTFDFDFRSISPRSKDTVFIRLFLVSITILQKVHYSECHCLKVVSIVAEQFTTSFSQCTCIIHLILAM